MVRECTALGMTPLTEEEFVAEERRMYTDLMNRRHGIYEPVSRWPHKYGPVNFGSYT